MTPLTTFNVEGGGGRFRGAVPAGAFETLRPLVLRLLCAGGGRPEPSLATESGSIATAGRSEDRIPYFEGGACLPAVYRCLLAPRWLVIVY